MLWVVPRNVVGGAQKCCGWCPETLWAVTRNVVGGAQKHCGQ